MVEFKRDARTGTPYLMEVNGRFWGSLQLAIDSGANFPVRLVEACTGVALPPDTGYRTGVRVRWLWGDVDHLLLRLLRPARALALPFGAPSRGRVVLDFLAACGPRVRNEVWRWNDPMPFVRESLDWVARR
jgi:predicted ATP-grasp superfamily ATP-dependent carboligase